MNQTVDKISEKCNKIQHVCETKNKKNNPKISIIIVETKNGSKP